MTDGVRVVRRTVEDLRAEVAAIKAEFPALAAFDPGDYCCSGCATTAIRQVHGAAAADAWERLETCWYLLGGDA